MTCDVGFSCRFVGSAKDMPRKGIWASSVSPAKARGPVRGQLARLQEALNRRAAQHGAVPARSPVTRRGRRVPHRRAAIKRLVRPRGLPPAPCAIPPAYRASASCRASRVPAFRFQREGREALPAHARQQSAAVGHVRLDASSPVPWRTRRRTLRARCPALRRAQPAPRGPRARALRCSAPSAREPACPPPRPAAASTARIAAVGGSESSMAV